MALSIVPGSISTSSTTDQTSTKSTSDTTTADSGASLDKTYGPTEKDPDTDIIDLTAEQADEYLSANKDALKWAEKQVEKGNFDSLEEAAEYHMSVYGFSQGREGIPEDLEYLTSNDDGSKRYHHDSEYNKESHHGHGYGHEESHHEDHESHHSHGNSHKNHHEASEGRH